MVKNSVEYIKLADAKGRRSGHRRHHGSTRRTRRRRRDRRTDRAAIAGYETMTLVGMAAGGMAALHRGFHPTSLFARTEAR